MKPSEYRSKTRIYVDILESVRREGGKARFTKILYSANLSYHRLQRYLAELEEKGLLVKLTDAESDVTWYELTEKVYKLLAEFWKIKRLLDAFGLSI